MSASSDDIIRHIIRDIVSRSTSLLKSRYAHAEHAAATAAAKDPSSASASQYRAPGDVHVTETVAAFIVRAVVLDPRNSFRIEEELGRDEVERLIKICVDRITAPDSPVIEAVKMQVYFDTNFPAQSDFLHKEKISKTQACAPLLREIVDVKTKAIAVYEALYRKIVSYLLLRSHVGSPTDMRVIRETTAALESVFPQSELSTFISLSRSEKEAQLNGLAQLVTGIRLFNKQLGKGGEGVEDLPSVCASELTDLKERLKNATIQTEELIQTYLAVIDYADKSPRPELGDTSLARLRSSLIFRRQLLIYLDALTEQTERSDQTLHALAERFEETVRELKITCRAKTAVPVDQVYPQFIMLANLWTNYMEDLFLLAFRKGILDTLDGHSKAFTMNISPIALALAQEFRQDIEPEIQPEDQIISNAVELMTAVAVTGHKGVEVVHPGNTTQYYRLPVEFGGFCPYTLTTRDGLVVPGNKNLGLIRHRDKLYALATPQAARAFATTPDTHIEHVLTLARHAPSLVQLLHLYPYFPTVDALENARSFTRQRLLGRVPLVAEVGTQVETHPVEERIVKDYEWNEWELRRKAIMLVNLRNKQTHSVQTNSSHFRREGETQHYEPRSKDTQTLATSHTQTPIKKTFLSGLRHVPNPRPSSTTNGSSSHPENTMSTPNVKTAASNARLADLLHASTSQPTSRASSARAGGTEGSGSLAVLAGSSIPFKVRDLTIDTDGQPAPYGGGGFGNVIAGTGYKILKGKKKEVSVGGRFRLLGLGTTSPTSIPTGGS
ncbi:hypothetical protein DFS34DRAFT_662809 [Phlyctochytrium arcticum]|nr:hypothetical protein DFS34DRAFT_662809 [Phlyctochytrium arcticum]